VAARKSTFDERGNESAIAQQKQGTAQGCKEIEHPDHQGDDIGWFKFRAYGHGIRFWHEPATTT